MAHDRAPLGSGEPSPQGQRSDGPLSFRPGINRWGEANAVHVGRMAESVYCILKFLERPPLIAVRPGFASAHPALENVPSLARSLKEVSHQCPPHVRPPSCEWIPAARTLRSTERPAICSARAISAFASAEPVAMIRR